MGWRRIRSWRFKLFSPNRLEIHSLSMSCFVSPIACHACVECEYREVRHGDENAVLICKTD